MVGVDGVSRLGPVDCDDECEGDEQPATNSPRAAMRASRRVAMPSSYRLPTGPMDRSSPALGGATRVPPYAGTGPQIARRLVLPDSFYSPRVASQRGSIRCVHEVRRGEERCLSSLRLLTWR